MHIVKLLLLYTYVLIIHSKIDIKLSSNLIYKGHNNCLRPYELIIGYHRTTRNYRAMVQQVFLLV